MKVSLCLPSREQDVMRFAKQCTSWSTTKFCWHYCWSVHSTALTAYHVMGHTLNWSPDMAKLMAACIRSMSKQKKTGVKTMQQLVQRFLAWYVAFLRSKALACTFHVVCPCDPTKWSADVGPLGQTTMRHQGLDYGKNLWQCTTLQPAAATANRGLVCHTGCLQRQRVPSGSALCGCGRLPLLV